MTHKKLRTSHGMLASKLAIKKGKNTYPISMQEIRRARESGQPIMININMGQPDACHQQEQKAKNPVPSQLAPYVKKKQEERKSDWEEEDEDYQDEGLFSGLMD